MKTEVNCIKCSICDDIIYSRARHDFRTCSCGNCSIDGGFDYMKISFEPTVLCPTPFVMEINASKSELFDDWNLRLNKYGLIKTT